MIPGFDSRYWNGQYPEGYDYQYIFIKATEGKDFHAEPQKTLQTQGAKDAGLLRGYYHFYRFWAATPDQQAEWFFEHIPHDAELPPVIDLEDPQAPKSLQNVNKIKQLCDRVEALTGKKPIIYTAAWWWNSWVWPYLPASGWDWQTHDLWVANYTSAPMPVMPLGWSDWQIWQHIGDWSAPGFNAKIDVNRAKPEWYNQFLGTQPPDPKEGIEKEVDCIQININKIRKLLEEI